MRTIFHVYLCCDHVGEVEGMFSEDGILLGTWSCDDGMWRGEYFNGFMKNVGIEVVSATKNKELADKLYEHWMSYV